MAQRRGKGLAGGRAASLATRLGLRGRVPLAVAGIALALVAAALGCMRLAPAGLLIERGSEPGAAASPALANDGSGAVAGGVAGAEGSQSPDGITGTPKAVAVHVDGAVSAPGLFRLQGDDLRVADAIAAAGGLAEDADTSSLNLAAPLTDGTKVYVAHVGEQAPVVGEAAGVSAEAVGGALVNVNAATPEELQALSGIGEATARAIVEERERGGPFESVDDLLRVTGIGEKKLERIRDHVCV